MQQRHTAGPWKYGKELTARAGEWLISLDAGDRGRGIAIAETRPGSGSERANARLIAAAPTLLCALRNLRDATRSAECFDECEAADAAIALALGHNARGKRRNPRSGFASA